jgi:hypothetical protein
MEIDPAARLFQQADTALVRAADTFARADFADLQPASQSPAIDVYGAALGVASAQLLGAMGGALFRVEQRTTATLVDVIA